MDTAAYGIEIYGAEGRLAWKSSAAWRLPTPHFVPGMDEQWEALTPIYPDHYDPEKGAAEADYWFTEEFVQALDNDRDHECSGDEALHVVEIMMGIFESGAYGKRVTLPQQRRDHPLLRWRSEAGLDPPAPMPRAYGEWLAEDDKRLGRT